MTTRITPEEKDERDLVWVCPSQEDVDRLVRWTNRQSDQRVTYTTIYDLMDEILFTPPLSEEEHFERKLSFAIEQADAGDIRWLQHMYPRIARFMQSPTKAGRTGRPRLRKRAGLHDAGRGEGAEGDA